MKSLTSKLLTLALFAGLFGAVQFVYAATPNGSMASGVLSIQFLETKAINEIRVVDSGAEITAASDLWIRITSGIDAEWDSSDTTAVIDILGTGVVSTTVSYTQSDGSSACSTGIDCKVLKLNVTTNFGAGDVVDVSGLSMIGGITGSPATALEWSVDGGAAYGTGDSNTEITVTGTSTAPTTETSVENEAPVIIKIPSDGGSTTANPTKAGSNVTFTVRALDVNNDTYYGAFCKTDAVTAGSDAAPTCDSAAWAVSGPTSSNSDASGTYTASATEGNPCTGATQGEVCPWFAFVCDKVMGGGTCFPANANGDQGSALGTIVFSDVPADEDDITIDDVTYVFDTDNNGIVKAGTEVDTSASLDASEAAAALVAVEAGVNSSMTSRGAVVYVFADDAGTGDGSVTGNSVDMAVNTCANCSVSDPTLSGGSDDNASPFEVNHEPTFTSVTFTDTGGGTIEPGDTVRINLTTADIDTTGGTDDVHIFVCADGDTFNGANCSSDEYCQSAPAVPNGTTCSFAASRTDVPTANQSYSVEVFIVDEHGFVGTQSSDYSYTVTDVIPTLISYTATDAPAPAAGGSYTVDFSVVIADNNGDNDVTAVEGVFFDDTAVNNNCSADEHNCYIDVTCTLSDVSSPTGAGTKTFLGTDANVTASCQVTVYFNANDSSNWEVHANPTDDLGKELGLADSNENITNPPLSGLALVQGAINYGTVAIGGTSSGQETSIGNVGNLVIDILLDGVRMTSGANAIAAVQQKWHNATLNFDWDSDGTTGTPTVNDGAWILVSGTGDTPAGPGAAVTDEDTGCVGRDLVVRAVAAATTENESIYWKIRIPATQESGNYSGSNTFSSTAACTNSKSL